ncbi:hypothetical protein QCE49_23340 [Caballeronia sp. LZ008]|uniref:hypothetical protein n=1 Tax=unclassified Caballeronia TaxID=2646786 RepID=UPI002028CA69|nr:MULTISPECIES: hypothetical protein [unclassified Caballeronia]MDR5796322.1 hypothetical protein [Caballeronia sp. LZ008]
MAFLRDAIRTVARRSVARQHASTTAPVTSPVLGSFAADTIAMRGCVALLPISRDMTFMPPPMTCPPAKTVSFVTLALLSDPIGRRGHQIGAGEGARAFGERQPIADDVMRALVGVEIAAAGLGTVGPAADSKASAENFYVPVEESRDYSVLSNKFHISFLK